MLHSRSLLVIHFKYSSVEASIPNSLTIHLPTPFHLVTIGRSVNLWVCLCFVNKFTCNIFFLDSTYKGYHVIYLFLWLTSLSMTVSNHHLCGCKWHYFILFNGWVVFHWMYVPHHFYPLLCQWTFRLLPCLGYCKQCCSKHWDTCIPMDHLFLWTCSQEWDCRVIC